MTLLLIITLKGTLQFGDRIVVDQQKILASYNRWICIQHCLKLHGGSHYLSRIISPEVQNSDLV
jgi:hypothetical protein